MADNLTCQGCQSFCMLGKQLVSPKAVTFSGNNSITVTHNKTGVYPDTWTQWKNIQGYADNKQGSSIQTSSTLSAKSQLDLIKYIQDAWNEGEVNASKITESINEWNSKHTNGINGYKPSAESIKTYGDTKVELAGYDKCDKSSGQLSSNDIIYANHYNLLCNILAQSAQAITEDLKGESITNDAGEGPMVGYASDRSTSGDALVQGDGADLIKGSYYRKLEERVSKLMYHPYQCNYCNIYEGGGWTEIVEDVGKTISDSGALYSWSQWSTVTSNGYSSTYRHDCSGFVNACVNIFNGVLTGTPSALTGNSSQYEHLSGLPNAVQPYFKECSAIGSYPTKKGSIMVRFDDRQEGSNTSHVEVYGQWSGGGEGGEGTTMMHRISTTSCNAGMEYLYDE